jgi:hypothetical protein
MSLSRARRTAVLGVCAGLLAAPLLVACSGDDTPGASASPGVTPTVSPGSTEPAGPPPPTSTATPSVGISTAPAVKIGKTAKLNGDVVVKVLKVAKLTKTTPVPGEVAGPGVAVTLSVANGTSKPFSLTGLVVTASYGEDELPGETSSGKPAKEMTGQLAAGQSSRGVYVFRIPDGESADDLHLQVSSDQSPTVLLFER